MVKKLLKHELFALFRVLGFLSAAVFLLALAGRILIAVSAMQSTGAVVNFLMVTIIFFYVFSIIALIFAAYALGASRFYKTLFTGEGYMTLSLPVTPVQLLMGKLISSIIAILFSSLVVVLSLTVFLVGWNVQIMQTLYEIFGLFGEALSQFISAEPLYFAESIIRAVVSMPMILLIVFAVICVGQLFTNHRKAAMFAILIGVYFVVNVFTSLLSYPFSYLSDSVSPHLSNWIIIAIYAAVDVGCFFFICYILKNKVNLIV